MRGRRCTPLPAISPTRGSGNAKTRVLGGDDDVAGERGLEPAAHRDPVDRRDQRLVEIEAVREPGETGFGPRPAPARSLHLEIVAGRKGSLAGAGDDPDPQIRIGGELVPDRIEFPMRFAVQRVHDFRPVDRDDADAAFVGDGAEAVLGHS